MIFDNLQHITKYKGLSTFLDTAIDYLDSADITTLNEFTFEVDGKNVYGFVRKFQLSDSEEIRFESHRDYIDIQCLLQGTERMDVADVKEMPETDEYDTDRDITRYSNGVKANSLILNPGDFAIFFPWDAHKPGCKTEKDDQSLRMVIKVRV